MDKQSLRSGLRIVFRVSCLQDGTAGERPIAPATIASTGRVPPSPFAPSIYPSANTGGVQVLNTAAAG